MINHYKVTGNYKSNLQTPVAITFFTRGHTLQKTFDEVKKARPAKLFLIQDGKRETHNDDWNNMVSCRKIVEDIDWECDVYQNYADESLGAAQRLLSGFSWVFENVDRAIILEDDCLPNQSFFPFCEELLEKYLDDERINMITGYNFYDEMPEIDESYFFGKSGTNWGWATWARAWKLIEFDLHKIHADTKAQNLFAKLNSRHISNQKITWINNVEQKFSDGTWTTWDVQWGLVKDLYFQLAIIPKCNMIDNIGCGDDSAHFSAYKTLSFDDQKLFHRNRKEMSFPLIHPNYIIPNLTYDKHVEKIVYACLPRKVLRKIDHHLKKIFYSIAHSK